jgi:ferric-dicitrate binding protein FerR (iron transport regulator)
MTIAGALLAGLLAAPLSVTARDGRVEILHGQPAASALSVAANAGGTGVTIYRGSAAVVPARPAAAAPVAFIDGQRISIDSLEPATGWFIDRSAGRLVVVHCFTRQPLLVGANRRILCDARRF